MRLEKWRSVWHGGFIFFFVLVSVGGLEGDDNGVGGWGRGKWREHAGLFNFLFFFNII
jgi:hypothetical protein